MQPLTADVAIAVWLPGEVVVKLEPATPTVDDGANQLNVGTKATAIVGVITGTIVTDGLTQVITELVNAVKLKIGLRMS